MVIENMKAKEFSRFVIEPSELPKDLDIQIDRVTVAAAAYRIQGEIETERIRARKLRTEGGGGEDDAWTGMVESLLARLSSMSDRFSQRFSYSITSYRTQGRVTEGDSGRSISRLAIALALAELICVEEFLQDKKVVSPEPRSEV